MLNEWFISAPAPDPFICFSHFEIGSQLSYLKLVILLPHPPKLLKLQVMHRGTQLRVSIPEVTQLKSRTCLLRAGFVRRCEVSHGPTAEVVGRSREDRGVLGREIPRRMLAQGRGFVSSKPWLLSKVTRWPLEGHTQLQGDGSEL